MLKQIPLDIFIWITGKWERFHRRLPIEVLARQLGSEDRLWIIDRPLEPTLLLRDPKRVKTAFHVQKNGLSIITPRLALHDHWAYRTGLSEAVNLNLMAKQLKPLARPGSRKVHWFMHPCFWPYSRLIDSGFILYDCYDEYTETPGIDAPRLFKIYEDCLLRRANLTLVASQIVKERKISRAKHLLHIPNPTDLKLFMQARHLQPLPVELQKIPEPRVAYVGGVKPVLDFELLEFLAHSLPFVSFVLIGALYPKTNYHQLLKLPNVYSLGFKEYVEIPAYLSGMHVGIIPYKLNEYSRMLQPNKAVEYLAAGLEVVSTAIPGLSGLFPDYLHVTENSNDFLDKLRQILTRNKTSVSLSELTPFSWDYYLQDILNAFRKESI
jgi:glycosyltransferase involved in cell wall biosynthesis